MKVEDLIKDSYYKLYHKDAIYYFRFERYDTNIYSYGWEIRLWADELANPFYILNESLCETINFITDSIEEIQFTEIINFLPDTNSDKINFLRKKKLDILLSNES